MSLPTAHRSHALQPAEADAMSAALDALGVAWWLQDAGGRCVHLSRAAEALFGPRDGEAAGRADVPSMLSLAADRGEADAAAPRAIEQSIELDGKRRHLVCTVVRIAPEERDGAAGAGSLVVCVDRSEQRAREAELASVLAQLEAQQDAQRLLRAELDNRAEPSAPVRLVRREQFEDQLGREIDLSLREHREFAVVYIGIDPTPGGIDAAGDPLRRAPVLAAFDGILRGNTRAMDAPSQLDGDRFALLLSGVGLATAHARMEGLRRQCATQLIAHGGAVLRFTVSMGVASYPHTSQTQAGLQRAAQTALEQARQRGGNHVALASIAFGSA